LAIMRYTAASTSACVIPTRQCDAASASLRAGNTPCTSMPRVLIKARTHARPQQRHTHTHTHTHTQAQAHHMHARTHMLTAPQVRAPAAQSTRCSCR
jgi:hypothetical protein